MERLCGLFEPAETAQRIPFVRQRIGVIGPKRQSSIIAFKRLRVLLAIEVDIAEVQMRFGIVRRNGSLRVRGSFLPRSMTARPRSGSWHRRLKR